MTSTLLPKIYSKFVLVIKVAIIANNGLDYYEYTDNSSYFCNLCYSMIVEKKILKFGSANCINILPCQKYPDILSDLTLVKEAFIVCAQPILSIIKLRPSKTGLTALYYWI